MRLPVSVIIPTKNEERNIEETLDSVSWADEVYVFDSYSDDKTIEIAEKKGAKVAQRVFDDFATHKNWAMDNLKLANEWIFLLDADERVSPELKAEIKNIFKSTPACNGYYIARKNIFAGVWIRHGGWYPDWQMRLLRRGYARYEERIVHEHILLDGEPGFLNAPVIHKDYKGIERWFDRHNHYSSLEAVEVIKGKIRAKSKGLNASLFKKGPEHKRFLKLFAYRYLPGRPFFKFIYTYILLLGFLDGRIGFRFCFLQAFHDYQVSLKVEELLIKDSPLEKKYRHLLD